MKYIKGVYLNRYKSKLFNISVFVFLPVCLVLAVFLTAQVFGNGNGPRATISRTSDKESGVQTGDIIRYTVKIMNLDTVEMEYIKLVESLPQELEYLGNESLNYGDIAGFNLVQVDSTNYNLEFKIDFSNYSGDLGRELTLSYDVRVLGNSAASSTINTISHMYCYAETSVPMGTSQQGSYGLEEGVITYQKSSYLHMIRYINAVNNISVKVLWLDSVDLPEYVEVRLYKNAEPYSGPVRLSPENNWEYTWDVFENATPSNSSPSNAEGTVLNPQPVQWYVRQETVLEGYVSDLEILSGNRFVFTNRYILNPHVPNPSVPSPSVPSPSVPDTSVPSPSVPDTSVPNPSMPDNNNNSNSNNRSTQKNSIDTLKEKKRLDEAIKAGKLVNTEVSVSTAGGASSPDYAEDGDVITYHIKLKNLYDRDLIGLRVREYIPEFTHYYAHSGSLGEYGYVNGKEHVTWFIPVLKVGESADLEFQVTKDYCVQGNITTKLYYELTGSKSKPYANMAEDPGNVIKSN